MSRLVLVLALCLALAAVTAKALAHDWYPRECCSIDDCRPYPAGKVKAGPDGWVLSDGTRVPYGTARPSPDRQFHRCDFDDGDMIVSDGSPCFWAPGAEG